MSKFRNIALLSLVVLTLSVTGCTKATEQSLDDVTNNATTEVSETEVIASESTESSSKESEAVDLLADLGNRTYLIEGEEITLTDGKAETEIVPDSATKMKTEIWGDPLISYNEDGTVDYAAVILINDGGGSGTFYYVAAPINKGNGDYYISEAQFIGDRVKIESVLAGKDGDIVIDYLKHGEDQSMADEPTENAQSTFVIVDDILNKVE